VKVAAQLTRTQLQHAMAAAAAEGVEDALGRGGGDSRSIFR
jgi:hypothetical protein